MDFLKLDPDIDSDPDVEDAGWVGARVFELLLKVSAKKDLRGRIPPQFQARGWLARRWNLTAEDLPIRPEDLISNGVQRLISVGLVTLEDGCWCIRGWDKFYSPPKTNAERQAEFRERAAEKRNESNARNESNGTPPDTTPPTPPDYTPPPPTKLAVVEEKKPTEDDFWAWSQVARARMGLPPEPARPKKLEKWHEAAEPKHGADALMHSYERYLEDDHFRETGWPMAVFISPLVFTSRLPVARKVRL